MSIYTETKLETISYGQAGWDKIMNSNSAKMEEIFSSFAPIWDASSKTDGQVIAWNGSAWAPTAASYAPPLALVDGSIIDTDAKDASIFTVILSGNRTFANPTNLTDGRTYYWAIGQDGVGTRTAVFGSNFKFATTPVLSTGSGVSDMVIGTVEGTNIHCVLEKDFS
jgi:hypothetical protein